MRVFGGKGSKIYEPLQSVKSLLTRPYNQLNRCEHAGPAHVGPSQFRRAEDGPRSGRGRGRWRLQVFSKCFEWTATDFEILRNGVNVHLICSSNQYLDHRSLPWTFIRNFPTESSYRRPNNTTTQISSSEWLPKSDLVGPNSEHFVCWS